MQIRVAFKQNGGCGSFRKSIGNEKTFSPLLVYMFHLARLSKVTNAPICPEFAIKCDSASESIRRSIRYKESIRSATGKPAWLHLHAQDSDINWESNFMQCATTLKELSVLLECAFYFSTHFSLSRIKVSWLLILFIENKNFSLEISFNCTGIPCVFFNVL